MKKWYAFYAQSDTILHQAGGELEDLLFQVPWRHHCENHQMQNSRGSNFLFTRNYKQWLESLRFRKCTDGKLLSTERKGYYQL